MNRRQIINAIVVAAREPVPAIVEIIQFEHSGERQQNLGGIPPITTTSLNQQVVGYAFTNPQGIPYGRIEYSRDDLVNRHKLEEDREMDGLRGQLEQLNDTELQLQASLWLSNVCSELTTLHTIEYSAQDRERDARLWRIMRAGRRQPRAAAKATQHEGWPPASANGPDAGLAPRFHDSHEAKHSLLAWLSENPEHFLAAFISALTPVLSQNKPSPPRLADYLCASPRDVAIAADDALRTSGLYQVSNSDNTIRGFVRPIMRWPEDVHRAPVSRRNHSNTLLGAIRPEAA